MNSNNGPSDRCVTFDLWETLIFDDPDYDKARGRTRCEGLRSVLAGHGLEFGREEIMRAYEESAPALQSAWNRNEEVPIRDQVSFIVELAAGKPVSLDPACLESLEKAYVDPVLSIPPRLSKEARAVLESVRSRGYRVGLISNTGRSPGEALRKLLNACGVLEFFDATVFSNEVLRRKPDLLIFNRAASLLRAEKKSIVHVGDNPDADFWGAKDAGMQAILLEESRPETSRWGPNSLYALGRANMRRTEESIPARLRVRSLTEVPALVDSMFEI